MWTVLAVYVLGLVSCSVNSFSLLAYVFFAVLLDLCLENLRNLDEAEEDSEVDSIEGEEEYKEDEDVNSEEESDSYDISVFFSLTWFFHAREPHISILPF